jgi:ureidoglycolate lyase
MDIDRLEIAYVPTTGVRRAHETPVVLATDATLKGYGCLVDDPKTFPIEIVPWPAQGWRAIDPNTGDQGGVTEGLFEFCWRGETLYARNNAVGDSYLFGWSNGPEEAAAYAAAGAAAPRARERALIWRANYHPDGGQLFYPLKGQSFVVPLALPGDDVTPENFVTFWCDGSRGLYLHPNVWHGAVVPLDDEAEFLDRQGRVHARVSVDFAKEFGVYLAAPLQRPSQP